MGEQEPKSPEDHNEALFRSLVQHVPGAIYRYSEGGDGWAFTYLSPAIESITGYPADFFLGKADAYDAILHPDDREQVKQRVADAIASNEDFRFEHRIVHKNGDVRWVRTRGTMAADPATGKRAVDGVQLDVTDLYETREALQRREATFRNLFNTMAEGYLVFVPDEGMELINPAGLEILGYPDADTLKQVRLDRLWLEPEEYGPLMERLRAAASLDDCEFDVIRGDGVPITVGATLHYQANGGGERVEMTFRDITDRKLVEEMTRAAQLAAESANRAKSTFLANMSHELRTPMNAIIGYSEILLEEAEDEEMEGFARDLRRIHSAGEHLLALINDVLDLSKIEAGKMELFLEPFDLDKVVEDVAATVDSLIRKNENRLVVDVQGRLGEVNADRTKVRQALFNLISNASKFTKQGTVTLTAERSSGEGGEWIHFAVSDTGIGIPPDKIDKIFEEFAQAEDSTTRNYGGTGLGLPITKRFCEMMGGRIDVTSRPGEGSTFRIRLPAEVRELKEKKAASIMERIEALSAREDGPASETK